MKKLTCLLTLLLITGLVLVVPATVRAEMDAAGNSTETETESDVSTDASPTTFREAHPELKDAIKNAKEVRQQEMTRLKEDRAQVKQEREQNKEDRCATVTARIQNRVNNYNSTKDKYSNRYQGVVKLLQDLITKLNDKGCDTSTVAANLKTFQGMIEEFAATFRTFIDSLGGTQNYVCGESQGKFAGALKGAQGNLQAVKTKAEALRSYYQNTLRPNVKALSTSCRAQIGTPAPSEAPESAN